MILIFFERKKQHLKENSMDFTMFHRGSTSGSLRQCLGKSARDQFSIQAGQQCNDAVLSLESGTCFTMKMDEHG